jgi:hypothetical protein
MGPRQKSGIDDDGFGCTAAAVVVASTGVDAVVDGELGWRFSVRFGAK